MFLVIYKSFQINEYVKKLFFSPSVKSAKNRLHTFFFLQKENVHIIMIKVLLIVLQEHGKLFKFYLSVIL